MSMGVLNNIAATYAANNLSNTQASLQNVLTQLSSGSRINSGADDAAGLSLANGLQANQSALTQSASNVSLGVGLLQTADGALSQVNNLLNRAVTLATEAGNGTLNGSQDAAANQEYQSILAEINNIGAATTYNGNAVFGACRRRSPSTPAMAPPPEPPRTRSPLRRSPAPRWVIPAAPSPPAPGIPSPTRWHLSRSEQPPTCYPAAPTAPTARSPPSATPSAQSPRQRGYLGSQINTLNSMASVETTQSENLASASNSIMATDYTKATSELSKYQILTQTGISALAQANSTQQAVTKLLQ